MAAGFRPVRRAVKAITSSARDYRYHES